MLTAPAEASPGLGQKTRPLVLIGVLCGVALGLGGIIYLFWRPHDIYFTRFLKDIGLGSWLEIGREMAQRWIPTLPDWILFALPNGLWAFAYAVLISFIWWGVRGYSAWLWLGSIPLLTLGYESLQFLGLIPGVFSVGDLLACAVGMSSGTILGAMLARRTHRLRPMC
ncbi:hypothetical protein [Thiorhodospira sibirica]|uniref:hypothetical protein n=1 Tax=Thiorhodospira sibirica TaxID=154347 RepID=UPI00022C4009|nr:hypothetical protein [Thiorhodospira sibirica]